MISTSVPSAVWRTALRTTLSDRTPEQFSVAEDDHGVEHASTICTARRRPRASKSASSTTSRTTASTSTISRAGSRAPLSSRARVSS